MQDSEATLATRAYQRLREELLEGRFAPGVRLKVQDLAAEYGIGASPIREALSSLAAEGLAERFDQRGFRAASADVAAFDDLVRARCRIEEIVLRDAIAAGGPDWEEAVALASRRLDRLARSDEGDDNRMWEDAHRDYHDALLSACGSRTLLAFCAALRDRMIRYRNVTGVFAAPPRDLAAEHEAIAQAALAGETEEACRRLVEHYMATAEQIRDALSRDQAERSVEAPVS